MSLKGKSYKMGLQELKEMIRSEVASAIKSMDGEAPTQDSTVGDLEDVIAQALELVEEKRKSRKEAGEEVGETDAQSRFALPVEVEAEHVVVGSGCPYAIYHSRALHLGYYESSVFLAQVGVFARKAVVVAPCAVVAGELFDMATVPIFGQTVDGAEQNEFVCPSVFVTGDGTDGVKHDAEQCQRSDDVMDSHIS